MRNPRSALWALGLAGATYLWRNRERLQQQFSQRRQAAPPRELPDYNNDRSQQPAEQGWEQPRDRQWGGTEV